MAIYFEDKYIKCKCGSDILYEQEISRYSTNKFNDYLKHPIEKRLICLKCNQIVVSNYKNNNK